MIQVGGVPTPQELSDSKVNLGNPNNPVDATYTSGGTGISTDIIWTRNSGSIYPTTIGDKVSIGTTTFISNERLRVSGIIDTDSLRVANAYIDYGRYRSGIYYASLYAPSLTSSRTIILPNKSGTVVLDIDLPANLTLLGTYNQTNANISNAISLSHTHSNYSDLNGITSTLISHWNTAYSWGDWSSQGFLTAETDPVFLASVAYNITAQNTIDWTDAFGWGDHANAGYLTSETDPVFTAHIASLIDVSDILAWNDAVTLSHTHTNKSLLDSLVTSGSASYYLGMDGTYHALVTTVPGSNTQVIFNDGGAFGTDSTFTFNKTSNLLSLFGAYISDVLYIGTSYMYTGSSELTFYDTVAGSVTLNTLKTGATNYWNTTTGGIYYASYISNHINPTAELDITGHIIATDFDSNYIRYKNSNLLIGPNAGDNETSNNLLYIDNTNTGTPLIKGDFYSRYLEFNGNVFLNGELNFTDANTSILEDLTYLYVKDVHIGTRTLYSFIDGTVNVLVADFDDLATVQGIQASDLAVWNKAAAIVTSGPGTNYLSDDGSYNAISSSGVTPTDYTFKFDTGSVYYRPYTDKTEAGGAASAGKFYIGTSSPTATNRLNYDGNFYATNLLALNGISSPYIAMSTAGSGFGNGLQIGGTSVTGISITNSTGTGIISNSYEGTSLNIGTTASTTSANSASSIAVINKVLSGTYNHTGKLLELIDNPTTSGTVSGALISGIIGTTERFKVDPRSTTLGLKFETATTLASGSIAQFSNNTASVIDLQYDGSVNIPTGASYKINNVALPTPVTPTDDILDWSTDKYIPYAAQQAFLSFDTSSTNPTLTTRLNLNGAFYATSGAFTNISTNTFGSSTTAVSGVSGAGYAGQFQSGTNITLYVNKSGTLSTNDATEVLKIFKVHGGTGNSTGDIISIIDNPTTSGTISGKVLSATIGTTERISFNPRVADGASAVAYLLDTNTSLTTTGAKLVSIKNGGTEKALIDKDGSIEGGGSNFKITAEGGYAVKLIAGEALNKGEVVYAQQGGTNNNVIKNPIDGDMPIGVVYATVTSTSSVWIVISGIAEVLPNAADTAAMGYIIYSSSTTAGRVSQASTVPTATTHFRECGHWLATGSGAGVLTKAIIHFN